MNAWRQSGLRIAIGSNFDSRLRGVVAGLSELDRRVDTLVISSEIGVRKPHPRFYVHACESLRLEPRQVLFVGDDRENDVDAPTRAGCRAIWVKRAGPIDSVSSVPNLEKLGNRGGENR